MFTCREETKLVLMNEKILQMIKLFIEGQARTRQALHFLTKVYKPVFSKLRFTRLREMLMHVMSLDEDNSLADVIMSSVYAEDEGLSDRLKIELLKRDEEFTRSGDLEIVTEEAYSIDDNDLMTLIKPQDAR